MLPCKSGDGTEVHAPAEEARYQQNSRARREGRFEHPEVRCERLRVDVHGDGAQSVAANDPDHSGVRNGRDENLIPAPQTLSP